jgi:nucleoside-diphosphate-sugar epimerase
MKIIIPGGAGLVGHNLVVRLKASGFLNIVVIDKHQANMDVLKKYHPDVTLIYSDLAESGEWVSHFKDSDVVVMLHAQIGGNDYDEFKKQYRFNSFDFRCC